MHTRSLAEKKRPRPTFSGHPPPRDPGRNHPATAEKNGRTLNTHAPPGREKTATADLLRPPSAPRPWRKPSGHGRPSSATLRPPTRRVAEKNRPRPTFSGHPRPRGRGRNHPATADLLRPPSAPRPWPKPSGHDREEWPNSQCTRAAWPGKKPATTDPSRPTSAPTPWPKSAGHSREEWPNSQCPRVAWPRTTGHSRNRPASPQPDHFADRRQSKRSAVQPGSTYRTHHPTRARNAHRRHPLGGIPCRKRIPNPS